MKCYAFARNDGSGDECPNMAVQHWKTARGKVFGFCEEHKTKAALVNSWTLLSEEEALLEEVHEQ